MLFSSLVLAAVLQFLPLQPPESTPLAGIVVGVDGKPVAEADVWLSGGYTPEGASRLLDRTRSDTQGRFCLNLPSAKVPGEGMQPLVVWAYRPGLALGLQWFGRESVPAEDSLKLVLGKTADWPFKVLRPDGKPVGDAQVLPTSVSRNHAFGSLYLPKELTDRFGAETDADGKAVLKGFPAEYQEGVLQTVSVVSSQFGTQSSFGIADPSGVRTVHLRPVGRLSGRVVAEMPGLVKDLAIAVSTTALPTETDRYTSFGVAQVTSDAEGRFEVPVIAIGKLSIGAQIPEGLPYRLQATTDRAIETGKLTQLEVRLMRAIRATGLVRERGTGKGILGVTVFAECGGAYEFAQTDSNGRYECLLLPGQVSAFPMQAPKSYFVQRESMLALKPTTIAADAKEVVLPTVELVRGTSVRGSVVDDTGKPVAGASVRASWQGFTPWARNQQSASTGTNESGDFVLEGVEPGAELGLEASFKGASTLQPEAVNPGVGKPVKLRISGVALSGRVVDTAGKPVAGAAVEIWSQSRTPEGYVFNSEVVKFDGEQPLRTDGQGKFQTPPRLHGDGEYRVRVQGEEVAAGVSEWVKASALKSSTLPDVVIRRLRAVEGQVLDRQGKPVAGATVFQSGDGPQRTRATTDDQGRFLLAGVIEGTAFLFVEKLGFRFQGQLMDPSASTAKLSITRTGEPANTSLKTLPSVLAYKEQLDLALRLIEPYAQRVIKTEKDPEKLDAAKLQTWGIMARIDPARVQEQLEKNGFSDPDYKDYVRRSIAKSLFRTSLEEALAVVESMQDPYMRVEGYFEASDTLPESDRARKLELLEQTLLQARSIKDPPFRLVALGNVAERFLDLGQTDQATRLLREGQTIAKELPNEAFAGFARGAFAEELAQIDLPAALELTKDLSDPREYNRHHANIAHELAGKNSADAERVLGMLRRSEQMLLDQYSVPVCYRMASVDLARARRIAGTIEDPFHKAHAFGVMAQALANLDKPTAAELLGEAFAGLTQLVESGKDHSDGFRSAAVVAACLLPVAEDIDPQLVSEFLWRAVSLRLPPVSGLPEDGPTDQSNAELAMMLARYDRSLARTLFEPIAGRAGSLAAGGAGMRPDAIFAAAAVVDPRRAVELVESLPDDPPLNSQTPKNNALLTVAKTLSLEGEELWRELKQQHLALWTVDTEDL